MRSNLEHRKLKTLTKENDKSGKYVFFSFTASKSSKLQDNNSSFHPGIKFLSFLPDEEGDWEGGALLVRTRPRLDSEHSAQLVQHPGLGCCQTLQMTLGTTRHVDDLLLLKQSQPSTLRMNY